MLAWLQAWTGFKRLKISRPEVAAAAEQGDEAGGGADHHGVLAHRGSVGHLSAGCGPRGGVALSIVHGLATQVWNRADGTTFEQEAFELGFPMYGYLSLEDMLELDSAAEQRNAERAARAAGADPSDGGGA